MIPDVEIKFRYRGEERALRYRGFPVFFWRILKKETKSAGEFTPKSLFEGLLDDDVDAIVAMLFLEERTRTNDNAVTFEKVYRRVKPDDALELLDLLADGESVLHGDDEDEDEQAAGEAFAGDEPEEPEEEEPDPTTAAPTSAAGSQTTA